mmetsp:Transcript_2730/g.6387  ORF Transcript_2730/g.6387 Transcript_2730/m.6387 type:complete len:141 (+) Transcript_2730:189-611(+)
MTTTIATTNSTNTGAMAVARISIPPKPPNIYFKSGILSKPPPLPLLNNVPRPSTQRSHVNRVVHDDHLPPSLSTSPPDHYYATTTTTVNGVGQPCKKSDLVELLHRIFHFCSNVTESPPSCFSCQLCLCIRPKSIYRQKN